MGIDRMDGNGEYEKLIVDRALKKKRRCWMTEEFLALYHMKRYVEAMWRALRLRRRLHYIGTMANEYNTESG
jgi:hypothetical protein